MDTDVTNIATEGLLSAIIEKSQSDVILVFIILAIVLVIVGKPIYKTFSDNLANKRKREGEREKNLLQVIQGNSAVMAELKILLISSEKSCDDCKTAQLEKFTHLEDMVQRGQFTLNAMSRTILDSAERIKEIQKNK